jgi:hypothetical protein
LLAPNYSRDIDRSARVPWHSRPTEPLNEDVVDESLRRSVGMAELKTRQTRASVDKFLGAIKDEQVREDCMTLVDIMQKATGAPPQMWGTSIVGFGSYRYGYASGREVDWMLTAFSPRKQNLTLYIMPGFDGYDDLMARLGKHSCGKSCLYIKRLSDVHLPTLKKLVGSSVRYLKKKYPPARA